MSQQSISNVKSLLLIKQSQIILIITNPTTPSYGVNLNHKITYLLSIFFSWSSKTNNLIETQKLPPKKMEEKKLKWKIHYEMTTHLPRKTRNQNPHMVLT